MHHGSSPSHTSQLVKRYLTKKQNASVLPDLMCTFHVPKIKNRLKVSHSE
jgi:hypothetical protein